MAAIVVLEKTQPKLWQERLALPNFVQEENRHTPLETNGQYLPPTIISSRTITATENPILLAGNVYVPPNVTLTLETGTHVLVHEYGSLHIDGKLVVDGTATQPVTFSTNEANPINRVWSGIVFGPGSTGTITNTYIRHASPAITCEKESTVIIDQGVLELGNAGVVTASQACKLARTTIKSVDTGIIALVKPALQNVTIQAREQDIQNVAPLPAAD